RRTAGGDRVSAQPRLVRGLAIRIASRAHREVVVGFFLQRDARDLELRDLDRHPAAGDDDRTGHQHLHHEREAQLARQTLRHWRRSGPQAGGCSMSAIRYPALCTVCSSGLSYGLSMVLRRLYRWLRSVSESGRPLPQISRSISWRLTTRGDSRIRMVSSFSPIGESCSSTPPRVARRLAGSSTRSATLSTSEPTWRRSRRIRARRRASSSWMANGLVR